MKILLITPECPFPPEKSGGIHTVYNLIKASGECVVDVLYYGEENREAEVGLSDHVGQISYVPMMKTSRFGHLKSLIMRIPFALYRVSIPEKLNVSEYDQVILDQFSSLPFSAVLRGGVSPVALMHDSMPLYFSRKAKLANNFTEKIYYKMQTYFAERAETRFAPLCRKMVYVSDCDADEAGLRIGKLTRCESVSLGVDELEGVNPLNLGLSLVFTGIMNYGPNEDAAIYFSEKVFPEIKKRYPNISLYLVGKDPTERVLALSDLDENIVITGFVDDVFQYILGATIYISPLRYGTGVKNKVLEAMQCCKASVFSPVSIDGIPEIQDGINCLVAASDKEWIDSISLLLDSENVRFDIETALKRDPIGRSRSWFDSFESLIGE